MNTKDLKCFQAVYEERSVSRAARRAKSHPPKKISAARTKSPAKFASPWRKPLHIPCQSIIALTLSKTVAFPLQLPV